eukprot:TRINITY_DN10495_c0_g1_i1.p1 TRINITY_DN10495_c0_g1~~TRINITY_DN10495_c0_g1_i1.p1  ORF type:complete len:735 (+),score=99.25 TRINITY_DN10495_c0_g1_i1:324-2528(+)
MLVWRIFSLLLASRLCGGYHIAGLSEQSYSVTGDFQLLGSFNGQPVYSQTGSVHIFISERTDQNFSISNATQIRYDDGVIGTLNANHSALSFMILQSLRNRIDAVRTTVGLPSASMVVFDVSRSSTVAVAWANKTSTAIHLAIYNATTAVSVTSFSLPLQTPLFALTKISVSPSQDIILVFQTSNGSWPAFAARYCTLTNQTWKVTDDKLPSVYNLDVQSSYQFIDDNHYVIVRSDVRQVYSTKHSHVYNLNVSNDAIVHFLSSKFVLYTIQKEYCFTAMQLQSGVYTQVNLYCPSSWTASTVAHDDLYVYIQQKESIVRAYRSNVFDVFSSQPTSSSTSASAQDRSSAWTASSTPPSKTPSTSRPSTTYSSTTRVTTSAASLSSTGAEPSTKPVTRLASTQKNPLATATAQIYHSTLLPMSEYPNAQTTAASIPSHSNEAPINWVLLVVGLSVAAALCLLACVLHRYLRSRHRQHSLLVESYFQEDEHYHEPVDMHACKDDGASTLIPLKQRSSELTHPDCPPTQWLAVRQQLTTDVPYHMLVRLGPAVDCLDSNRQSLLTHAIVQTNVNVVACLADLCSSSTLVAMDLKGYTPIHWACRVGSLDCIKAMLHAKEVHRELLSLTTARGQSLLHLAVLEGHAKMLPSLLESGGGRLESSLFQTDDNNETPMELAERLGDEDCKAVLQARINLLLQSSCVSLKELRGRLNRRRHMQTLRAVLVSAMPDASVSGRV